MIDDVCALIGARKTGFDGSGNTVTEQVERVVFCKVASVTRSEFYAASTADLRPELLIILPDAADYQGENVVRYPAETGELYSVLRTYRGAKTAVGPNTIELALQRKMGTTL